MKNKQKSTINFDRLFYFLILMLLCFASTQAVLSAPCNIEPLPPTGPITSLKPQRKMTCNINGKQRQVIFYTPGLNTAMPLKLPVVFAFHPHGGTMESAAETMHIHTDWAVAIVVYPQGLPTKTPSDPDGNKSGWQHAAGDNGDRDLKLFDAMLATIQQTYSVDNDRVYTTGFSNGAAFSYLLWAERGKTIAAIGVCAGILDESEHITQPHALLAIEGKTDEGKAGQVDSINLAKTADSVILPGEPCSSAPDTDCKFFKSKTKTPVKTIFHPDGHIYPDWAPAEIVKFFQAHKRNP